MSITSTDRARLRHSGELSITVSKEYWNQGVATYLMKEYAEWLKTTDLKKINLSVKEDNKNAIKLYEKFGFKQEGMISRAFYINNRYYSSIFMGISVD